MGGMDVRMAELSRTIDPVLLGKRIKMARVAAGMTQAQLAGEDVTAAYLSRIEDGQRRPGAGLLERLAHRLGAPLEQLLTGINADRHRELQLAVDHAQLALAGGEAQTALAKVTEILAEGELGQDDPLRLDALRVQASAYEMAGDLNRAIILLEDLTATPSADATWLRSLIALSRCYRDTGELGKAVAVGERAEKTIHDLGIDGLTEAIQLTVTVAGAHYRLGDTELAMRVCLRALDAAEKHDSPIAQASAYWNASVIEAAAHGATPVAAEMARKALALFELGDDNRNLAKIRAQVASLQLAQDPPDAEGALQTLEKAERELSWSGASAWDIALLHITRGRAHSLIGNHHEALASVETGLGMAPDDAPFLVASAESIKGQVAAREGRTDEARERYRTAVLALTASGADLDAAQLWFELADLLTEVGDTEGALQAFRSAGASRGLRSRTRHTAAARI